MPACRRWLKGSRECGNTLSRKTLLLTKRFRCLYTAGNTLRLHLDDENHVTAEVVEVFQPFTLSCVMAIRMNTSRLKGTFVLKLYDRIHASQLRDDEELPWDPKTESEYRQFVSDGRATKFFDHCEAKSAVDEYWADEERDEWTKVEHEAYLQFWCRKTCNTERTVYDLLRDLQGKHVPTVFARPCIRDTSDPVSGSASGYLDRPGLLLEYIQGFPLTDLASRQPREDWQGLCEEAILILHLISQKGICNKDVRTRSFILRPNKRAGSHKYV